MQGVDRRRRVGEMIQRELADLLRKVKDPRISPMVTIGTVDVSRDLSYADVYYTILGRERCAATEEGFRQAAGYLRGKLAGRIRMKKMPQLRFHYDESETRARRLDGLLSSTVRPAEEQDA
ncbi:MAG: 30S ribosome-binding factor RbfA [Pseudomonadota bacterium]|nr:30S ribosome-binding factor RbfA [Pseudomonadota bacterium]